MKINIFVTLNECQDGTTALVITNLNISRQLNGTQSYQLKLCFHGWACKNALSLHSSPGPSLKFIYIAYATGFFPVPRRSGGLGVTIVNFKDNTIRI